MIIILSPETMHGVQILKDQNYSDFCVLTSLSICIYEAGLSLPTREGSTDVIE